MGLSGTLEAFPLSEVLRLLARSGQTGRLYAQSGDKEMRAYLQGGKLVVAWAGSDEAFGDELIARGLLGHETWDDVASGELPCEQALMEGVSALDFDRAVLDITTEGLAKMVDGRSGTFAFEEGNTTSLQLGTELDLDAVLVGVDDRLQSWRRLRSIVPDTSQPLLFNRAAAGETVEMSHSAWNLLVSLLPSKSLDSLVARTGRTPTAVIEDMLELLESGRATIDGFAPPATVEPEHEEDHEPAPGNGTEHLAYVGDDPLGGLGPIGWENELLAIPAADETEAEEDRPVPLIAEEEAPFLADADAGDGPGGFDFGLVGLDMAPNRGRNLLEKDDTWDAFSDLLGSDRPTAATPPKPAPPAEAPEVHATAAPDTDADAAPDADTDADADLGSVLEALDEALEHADADADTDVDPLDEALSTQTQTLIPTLTPSTKPSSTLTLSDPEPDSGPKLTLMGEGSPDDLEPEAAGDDLGALASVLSRLDLADDGAVDEDDDDEYRDELVLVIDSDAPSSEDLFPYDDAEPDVVSELDAGLGESVVDGADDGDEDADGSERGLPSLLRRRSRGALARELRSLSD